MSKAIGIDLGTTNSCVAVVEGGQPVIIANDKGVRTTPSVVAFTKEGDRLIGEPAVRQAVVNSDRTISSVKRHMGTDWHADIDGKKYTPQEISAMILRNLKESAECYIGEKITDAVITVPAYFNDTQRQATKDAGRIAGLNVMRIINEPTSAALAYGLNNGQAQKVMVYDLGGGTFDVSIIEIGDNVIEVLATNGDNHLGGDDFDQRIVEHILSQIKQNYRVELKNDYAALQRIKEAAEQAKKELSSSSQTTINLPYLTQNGNEMIHFEYTMTREIFNHITAAPYQRSVDIHVLQGERPMAKDNKTIGKFRLNGIKRAPAGVPQIEVTFDIDANGILRVSAKDQDTGKEQSITITESGRMSDSEIEAAIRDAEMYAGQDLMRKEAFTTVEEANRLIAKTSEALKNTGKDVEKSDKKAVKTELKKLEALVMKQRPEKMSEGDIKAIKGACDRLRDAVSQGGISIE